MEKVIIHVEYIVYNYNTYTTQYILYISDEGLLCVIHKSIRGKTQNKKWTFQIGDSLNVKARCLVNMKRCPTSLGMRDTQMNSTVREYFAPSVEQKTKT